MFKAKVLLLACAAFCYDAAMGQVSNHVFSGQIYDAETKDPLIGAIVQRLDAPEKITATDVSGYFEFKNSDLSISEAILEVKISYVGYEKVTALLKPNIKNEIFLQFTNASLAEIEVRGAKFREEGTKSLSVNTVGRELIERNVNASLGEVLSGIQGITFASFGSNIQLPIIHGLYGNRILILNNGFKHGFQNWGTDHAPEIDIHTAESISVVKGAAAVRYGPDALGGTVITETNSLPLNTGMQGNVQTGFQSNGLGYNSSFNLGAGGEKISWSLGGRASIVGDRHTPDYVLTNSGAREYSFHGGLRYQVSPRFSAKAYVSYVDQNLAILRASIGSSGAALIRNFEASRPVIIRDFSYDIAEPNQVSKHHLASVKMNWNYADDNFLSFRYAFQFNEREEFDVRRNADLPIIDIDLITHDAQLDWNHTINDKWDGIIGAQFLIQNNQNNPGTGITPFIPNYNSFRSSLFIIENFNAGNAEYEFGIRYDYERNSLAGRERTQAQFSDTFTFANVTAGIGMVKPIGKDVTFRSNIGSGWRPPNMAELYSFGQHEARQIFGLLRYYEDAEGRLRNDRVILLNESNVEAEQSYKWINEIEFNREGKRFNTSVYANYIANFIFWRPIGVVGTLRGPMPTYIFDQANAFLAGLDFTYEQQITKEISHTLGGSFIWSKNVERNEPLINQPPIMLNYELAWKKNLKTTFVDYLELRLQPNYTFRQFQAPRVVTIRDLVEGNETLSLDSEIFDFLAPPDGFFLLNTYAKIEKGKIGTSLSVHNALNTRYRDYLNAMRFFADDLGRNFILSIQYKF